MKVRDTASSGTIRDPQQIRALESPVRQEVVDTLEALGTASVREIAAELGRPPDALYYHVRALLESGLLVPAGSRGDGRRREALYALPMAGDALRLAYDPDDPTNVEAVTAVVGAMLRVAGRDFAAGFRPQVAVCEGPRRNLWAARMKGWLDGEELEEVQSLLERLRHLMDRPRRSPDQRLHSLTFVIAPAVASRDQSTG